MQTYPTLANYPYIAIDTECTGLEWWKHRMFGVSIAVPDGTTYYYDIRQEPKVIQWLRDELPKVPRVVMHNGKFDLHMLFNEDVLLNRVEDTMVRAALIDENLLRYDLDSLGLRYCSIGKDTTIYGRLAQIFGGKATADAQMPNLHKAPVDVVAGYARQDALTTLRLYEWQEAEIRNQELTRVYDVEMRLLPVLLDMERRGVRVDIAAAEHAVRQIDHEVRGGERALNKLAGFVVNPNPSAAIHKLFNPQKVDGTWIACDGTRLRSTEGGKPQLDADALRNMKHPAAAMILNLRKLIKTRDTFLKGHVLGHHHNGIIHANFNQTRSDNELGTGTGRLSCNSPALQQIHKRNKTIAAIVRAVFLPDPGQDWNCRDWSQMDFRVFAHYVEDPRVLAMYRDNPNADYHQLVADMTGLPRQMTEGIKGNAKQINLGLIFGMGSGKLAQEMNLPYTTITKNYGDGDKDILVPGPEAEAVFRNYHDNLPSVDPVLKKASSIAKSRGFVRTILGRRIRFPGGRFTHKAGGLVFQGSAADSLKVKLIEVHDYLHGTEGRLTLNVHDEFDTSLPKGDAGARMSMDIGRIVEDFSDGPIKFNVPIRSSAGVGPNWWEASK